MDTSDNRNMVGNNANNRNMQHVRFYTSKQLADMFQVEEKTIRTWYNTGFITGVRIGRLIRFTDKDINMLEEKGRAI